MKRPFPTTSGLRSRLVAAIRWDYEHGLLSMADVVRKYRQVASERVVRGIMRGETDPGVKAFKDPVAWARTSWARRDVGRPTAIQPSENKS
jgi:hypothetical protein